MHINDGKVNKLAILSLATILVVGGVIVFALSNYGGEIGLITHEEPRLAYLFCREEIKERLHLADYSLLDNYLDATIYTLQPHEYLVRIKIDMQGVAGAQTHEDLPCTITAQADGTWTISGMDFKQ